MKRVFLLLCIFCALYGLSRANFGESTEGELCPVTFNHRPGVDCDSAIVYFGYPSSNLYDTLKLFPLPEDSSKLFRDSLDLDSIGGHYAELRYYERGAGSVSGYLLAEWIHKDPTPGDTIQREASVLVASDNIGINWNDIDNKGATVGLSATVISQAVSVIAVTRVDSVRKVYILDSLDQTVEASVSQSDKEDIAEIVKDTAEAHPEIWTDQASGTGADTFNIYVFDEDTTAVEGVSITIYNKAHTAVAAPSLITDVNGLTTTFQDADTFHLYLQRLGVIYAQWDTIVVSNLGIDTIWVVAYDPGSPPSPDLTRLIIYNRDLGYEVNRRLTIKVSSSVGNLVDTTANVLIDFITLVSYSRAGSTIVDLIPSINLISWMGDVKEDSVRYNFAIYRGNIEIFTRKDVFVPVSLTALNFFTIFGY